MILTLDFKDFTERGTSLMERMYSLLKEQYPILSDSQIAEIIGVNKNSYSKRKGMQNARQRDAKRLLLRKQEEAKAKEFERLDEAIKQFGTKEELKTKFPLRFQLPSELIDLIAESEYGEEWWDN